MGSPRNLESMSWRKEISEKYEKDGQCEGVIDGSALMRQVKLVILRSISSNVLDEASCQPTSKVTRKDGAVLWSLYIAYRPVTGRQVRDYVRLGCLGFIPHKSRHAAP